MPVDHLQPPSWSGRSDCEDGEAALRTHHLIQGDASRALIGFACDAGVKRNMGRLGAKEGPSALRKAMANLAAPADSIGFSDHGDVTVAGDDLEAGQSALAEKISEILPSKDRVVVIGGGHETAFGSYCGIRQAFPDKKIGIINIDAHLDLRLIGDPGPSSGTPFTQIHDLDPDQFDYLCLGVAEESNTVALLNRAEDWNVKTVTDHALIAGRQAANEQIDAIISRSDLVYFTICLDALPHYQAPGVSAPAARGLPLSVVEYLLEYILSGSKKMHKPIPVADIVELSPPHDIGGMTAKTAALFARRLLFL